LESVVGWAKQSVPNISPWTIGIPSNLARVSFSHWSRMSTKGLARAFISSLHTTGLYTVEWGTSEPASIAGADYEEEVLWQGGMAECWARCALPNLLEFQDKDAVGFMRPTAADRQPLSRR
jgi:hypothetical protein